ncbi:MAG: M13 family metallopeptidase [Proteobacteria bacterium]|nr:M13 family metallopeptidase [Pseudomonadota bacterium]
MSVTGCGLDMRSIAKDRRPGENFFQYANAGWLASQVIPADQSSWSEWTRLADVNLQRVKKILEECAREPKSPEAEKLGDLYASLMDESLADRLNLLPLQPQLVRIDAIDNAAALAVEFAAICRATPRNIFAPMPVSPVGASIYWDYKNPTRYVPMLQQGGLGLPDRDYYFADRNDFVRARTAYRAYLESLFELAELAEGKRRAASVFDLECCLAETHRPRVELWNLEARYNLWTPEQLENHTASFPWSNFLDAAGFEDHREILIADPNAMGGLAKAVHDIPMVVWRDYLRTRALAAFASFGPSNFVKERFRFQGKILDNAEQPPPRWRHAIDAINDAMGPALGNLYLTRHFDYEAQDKARNMVANIIAAMRRRIEKLTWMSPPTKARAIAKLHAVRIDIAAEAGDKDYSDLIFRRDDAFGNIIAAAHFDYEQRLHKLSRPVDRGEWDMLAHMVNAQSNPILIKVMFPAGILQGLFFDSDADPARNYGGIGMVIAHELSHVFDNLGAQFDETGAMNNWWSEDDRVAFTARTEQAVEQCKDYLIGHDQRINGRLTLGENIADLAGLRLALDAYKNSLNGDPAPVIDGLTGEQRFFLAFAQSWREVMRPERFERYLATNSHAPAEYRVAQVRNLDEWYEAFGVSAGDAWYLAPQDRIVIW